MTHQANADDNQHPRRGANQWWLLTWDIAVITLVSANLFLILFDTLFIVEPIRAGLDNVSPEFTEWYDQRIHSRFQEIDLAFVGLLLCDVIAGWIYAAVQGLYARWWIYPFARWYDVLGCIPLSGFRLLRVLRVISILFRLQRMGLIDVRRWGVYRVFMRYYGIVMEELSDRVVENVLTSVQDEVRSGASQLPKRIVNEVVIPRRQMIAAAIATRWGETSAELYADNREALSDYLDTLITGALENHPAAKQLERIPGLGNSITDALGRTIANINQDVMDELIAGFQSPRFEALIDDMLGSILEAQSHHQPEEAATGPVMIEILELLKEQVRHKRWLEER